MKKLRISFILLAVMITFVGGMFFTSCEKENALEDNTNNREANIEEIENVENYDNLTVADMPQLEVKDGMLYFDNSEQYFKTIAIVGNMNEEELDNWEQELGFVSLRTMQNNTTVDPPDATLLIVNGKGSSRGVGNRWAILPK